MSRARIGRGRFGALAVGAALVVGLAGAYALGGGGRRTASAVSPDRTYRVDWVTSTRLDRALHPGMVMPARIELHDNITGRLVGTSELVDLDAGGNGQPTWLMADMGLVSVGPGAQFLHVPPLAPDDRPLPIAKEFDGAAKPAGRP